MPIKLLFGMLHQQLRRVYVRRSVIACIFACLNECALDFLRSLIFYYRMASETVNSIGLEYYY